MTMELDRQVWHVYIQIKTTITHKEVAHNQDKATADNKNEEEM